MGVQKSKKSFSKKYKRINSKFFKNNLSISFNKEKNLLFLRHR
ncbi:MAG: hypothetical protein ACSHUF_00490 [Candidatus Nasuia deltocephalinicola]